MKKGYVFSMILMLLLGSVFVNHSLLSSTSAQASDTSYIDVSPIGEDGSVAGSPIVTAVLKQGSSVEKVTFYAKAKNEPDANYYGYAPDYQAPYSWNWPTGAPWVPDGEYTLMMEIIYSAGETEILTRDIVAKNESEPNAPESPKDLFLTDRTSHNVTLSWTPSSSEKIFDYVIYQNGIQLAETTTTSFTVDGLVPGEYYSFRVKARDIYNNQSIDDNSINVLMPYETGDTDPLPSISQIQAEGNSGVTPGGNGYSGDVSLSVLATDNNQVEKVEFYVKVLGAPEEDYWKFPTTRKHNDTYSVNWSTTYTPEGHAIIKAIAFDSAGQSKTVTSVFLIDNVSDGGTTDPTWEPAESPPANRIVGYLAGWSTYGAYDIVRDLDASRLTHLNYAFALIDTNLNVVMSDPVQDPKNFQALSTVKETYPHLKTIIAIGGWGGSANFIEAAATEESREIFANSAVQFMVEHGFDGVDLDWEYPVTGGGPGTYPNPADRDNYPLLLEKLREKLDEQGEKDHTHYLLTIAGGATAGFANNTQLGLSQQYLDYVQIMTYDIHGTWESLADFNAPLFDDNGKTYSVDKGIQAYLTAGVPADKLVMGVPFYGYRYNVTSNDNNGLRQPFNGSGSITYNRIVKDDLLSNGYQRFFDEGSMVPYLYNETESIFISYDDEQSIALKAQYIRDHELGGAMIWELSQDHGNDLLSSLYEVLKEPIMDTTPPTTSAQITGEEWTDHSMIQKATVTLEAEDNRSGVEKTEYRLNEGEWLPYSNPIIIETDGSTRVDYRSIDRQGNIEDYSSYDITIISVTFENLYMIVDEADIHHGQKTALLAHLHQAERAKTAEKRHEKLEKALQFVKDMSNEHISETDQQQIQQFIQLIIDYQQ
ncbi:glycosyl hydrolase family 18 protein [Bacillus salitolerans]|uniref:chitinase n=1 Tax=Bacillus salitolerans TaxID=1437434 RepID=A0ABW4LJZ3_9BACI